LPVRSVNLRTGENEMLGLPRERSLGKDRKWRSRRAKTGQVDDIAAMMCIAALYAQS
jgi:hypothetical protein